MVLNRLRSLRVSREQSESGNTLVMFVMLFPLFMSVFGLAIDLAIANYVQNALKSSMNTATQITLSQASNPVNSDRPMLSQDEAYATVKSLYAKNSGRVATGTTLPFLMCQDTPLPGGRLTTAPGVTSCSWTEMSNGFRFSNANRTLSIEYVVKEVSDTAFLQFLGIEDLKHTLEGRAATNFSYNRVG